MSRAAMEKQINLVQTALRQASSWRISVTFAASGETSYLEEEVGCPFDFHRVGKVRGAQYRQADEMIARENDFYYREGDLWYGQHSVKINGPTNYCMSGANAGGSPLVVELEMLKRRARLKRGETQRIDEGSCREFDFIGIENSHPILGSLCVDEQTNLPFEYRYDDNVYRYSKWNEPVALVPLPRL